jgi:hypothetical protein
MHFNRASIVYGIMILLSASGVWAVLSIGQGLVAPEDLAGKWTLESRLPGTQANPHEMTVEQSGKFFQIAFQNRPNLNFVLDEQSRVPTSDGSLVRLSLSDGPWHLSFQGPQGGDDMKVSLTGPQLSQSGAWNAKRVVRKFPPDYSNLPAKGAN